MSYATEWFFAVLLIGILLGIDLTTYHWFPTPWCDEVSFGEPAINLAATGKLETSVWPAQAAGTFWTANSPLFPVLLSGWIRCFGFSLLAIRSFNFGLISIACLLIWFASERYGILKSSLFRLLLIPLIHLAYGVSFAYRSNRPDILGMIVILMFIAIVATPRPKVRLIPACLLAALSVWVGPQIGLLLGFAVILGWIFRWTTFHDVIATAIGGTIGTASLFLLLHSKGAMPDFLASAELGRTGGTGIQRTLIDQLTQVPFAYLRDFSLPPILLASILLAFMARNQLEQIDRRRLRILTIWLLSIPILLEVASTFAFYYSYLIYIPSCLVLLILCEAASKMSRPARSGSMAITAVACLSSVSLGLPSRLLISNHFADILPRDEIRHSLQKHVSSQNVTIAENSVFFETKQITPMVFGELYFRLRKPTTYERGVIDTLVIYPKYLQRYQSILGDSWEAVGPAFGDRMREDRLPQSGLLRTLLVRHFSNPQMERQKLQIYRRVRKSNSSDPPSTAIVPNP